MRIEGIDELDNRILEAIRNDARKSYSDIGAEVGLSRVAVKNRMCAMEEKGVIQGYRTRINETSAPEGVTFFLDLEVETAFYENVVRELSHAKEIRQLYSVAGNARIHAIGFAPNQKQMSYFARELYRTAQGIRKLECLPVLAKLKDSDGGADDVRHQQSEYLEGRTGGTA